MSRDDNRKSLTILNRNLAGLLHLITRRSFHVISDDRNVKHMTRWPKVTPRLRYKITHPRFLLFDDLSQEETRSVRVPRRFSTNERAFPVILLMNGEGTLQGWHSTANVSSRRIESQDQIRIGERLGIYLRPGEIISGIVDRGRYK